ITVLFADIRGYTSLAERIQPEECVEILNDYFCIAVEQITDFEGAVDRFQGDCVMARFGSSADGVDHASRAVQCALRLRQAVWSIRIPNLPEQRIRLGIGINTGVAIVAGIGSGKKMDYTAIGDAVNVAHRLQTLSKPDQILIGQNTRLRMGERLEVKDVGFLYLRGRSEPINAYAVQ